MRKIETLTASRLEQVHLQILPGEMLTWVGEEPRSRRLPKQVLIIVLLGAGSVLSGIFAAWMVLMNPEFLGTSLINMLPVLTPMFLAVAGVMLVVRKVVRLVRFEPDLYVLTTQRALVISPGRGMKEWLFSPAALAAIQVRRRRDDSGDIIFERHSQWTNDSEGRSTRQVSVIGFYGLACVDEVYRQVKEMVEPNIPLFNQS